MRAAAVLVLPLLLVVLALGGCGETSLTASQLRTQATNICTRASARTDRIALPSGPDQGGRFLRAGIAALRPAAHALQRLDPPSDLRESYAQAVQLDAKALALIERHERAIAHGEDAAAEFRALQAELDRVIPIERSTWQALQITACVPR
jgi:hypothetical protein